MADTTRSNKELSTLQSHKSKLLTQKSQLENLLRKQARLNSEILKLKKCIRKESKMYLKEVSSSFTNNQHNFELISEAMTELSQIESEANENFVFIKTYVQKVEELSFDYLDNLLETNQTID